MPRINKVYEKVHPCTRSSTSADMAQGKRARTSAGAPAAALAATEPSTSGQEEPPSRVLYIGHLPHGFYEDQLKGVRRLHIS